MHFEPNTEVLDFRGHLRCSATNLSNFCEISCRKDLKSSLRSLAALSGLKICTEAIITQNKWGTVSQAAWIKSLKILSILGLLLCECELSWHYGRELPQIPDNRPKFANTINCDFLGPSRSFGRPVEVCIPSECFGHCRHIRAPL